MDILCHALESYTARWYADFDAKQPEQRVPYCGANPIADLWSEKALTLLAGAFRSAVRGRLGHRRPASRWRWRRRSPGSASATPACTSRTPTPTRSPGGSATTVPEGYPEGEPIVPHGMAVSLTAPAAFRFTFDAAPERHLRAARLLDPDARGDGPGRPAARAHRADARHRDPQRPGRGRVRRRRRRRPGRRRRPAAAAAGDRARRRPRRRTWPGSSAPRWNTGDVTATPRIWWLSCAAGGSPTSTTRPSTRALYSSRRLALPGRPAGRRPAARTPTSWPRSSTSSRRTGVPVTMRGAGTSIAGNAVGPGIVVDTVKHLNRVALDRPRGAHRGRPARRRARQPAAGGGAARPAVRARTRRPTPAARSAG